MEIKLFSFIKNESADFSGSKKVIADCVNSFTAGDEKFKNFSSPKRMILSASQALRSADAVILAVQASVYNSAKKMICSVFHMETEQNEEIYSRLLPSQEKKEITKTALESNSLFPVESDIFATGDFKCCGFAVTEGGQSIIVMPLDEVKTNEVVFGSLYDFLGEEAGVENTENISRVKCAHLAAKLASLLKRNGSRLAFSSPASIQFIEESIDYADSAHENIFTADKPEARRTTQTVKDYIIDAAQKTRLDTKADYACSVSSAFASNTDNSTFIFTAVADKDETQVKKLFLKDGETPKQLYHAAAEEALLACVNTVISKQRPDENKERRADKNMRQKLAGIIAASIAGATGLCAVLALLLE